MSMPFGQPSSGDWFKPAEVHGHLILVTKVHEVGSRFDKLAGKDKPHAVFDMVDLDTPNPVLQQHVNDSHPGIANKLTKAYRTGEMVLGRIAQAPGQNDNPAWILGPFNPGQDDARAMQWVNANPLNNFGQPAGQQAAPAPVPAPVPQPQAYGQAPQQYAPAPMPTPPAPVGAPPAAMPQQYAPQPGTPAPMPQQYAPAPAAAPQAYQAPPAPAAPPAGQQMDPNNLTPEVQALLAQLQQNGGAPGGQPTS